MSVAFKDGDLATAIHLMDIVDTKFDNKGNLHLLGGDTGDFNKKPDKNADPKLKKIIAGGAQALDENFLEPRYYMYEVTIPREKLEQLGY